MAFDRLIKRIDELHNPSVAGLDPRLEYVPQFIQDASFVKLGHTLEAADFNGTHRTRDKEITEILPCPAGIFRPHQRSG